MFEFTLSLGNVLNIVAMVLGGMLFLYRMESRLIVLNAILDNFIQRINSMEREMQQLAQVTIQIARQDERMTAQDLRTQNIAMRIDEVIKRIDEMAKRRVLSSSRDSKD